MSEPLFSSGPPAAAPAAPTLDPIDKATWPAPARHEFQAALRDGSQEAYVAWQAKWLQQNADGSGAVPPVEPPAAEGTPEVSPERAPRLFQAARERGIQAWPLGTVTDTSRLRARLAGGESVSWTAAELREAAGATLARLWNEELE